VSDPREPKGRPLDVDREAESADPSQPAFVARPEGAPVYHGFRVIEDVEVDGFRLGAISKFGPDVTDGDAFIIAPDGSRAGLIWDLRPGAVLHETRGFEETRWGVWNVSFPCEVASPEDAARVLEHIVPLLRPKWEAWREQFGQARRDE
jgi:hypothetical protein